MEMAVIGRIGLAALALAGMLAAAESDVEMITAGYTTELSGPIDDNIAHEVKGKAYEDFRTEILGWLEVNILAEWDTKNRMDRLHLDRFARACADRAKQDSRFNGTRWTYTYSFPGPNVAAAAEQWNTRYDALAVQSYVQFNTALESRNLPEAYIFGVRTVYYARAHLGARKSQPGKSGKDFIYETRLSLKELLDRLSIKASDAIVGGKPGFKPDNKLEISAAFDDTVPLAGLKISLVLHKGPRLATVSTGPTGKAFLGEMLIPYVPNGTFFNLVPNPGAEIDTSSYFSFEEMDLGLTKSYSQTLMFKVTRPTFALQYRANAVSDVVIPRDISEPTYLVKFLRDSCHMDQAPAGSEADIALDVLCQVSSYEHDVSEKHVMKSEMRVTIEEKRSPRHSTVMRSETYEESYRTGIEVPAGQFFWQTARVLGRLVKTSLLSL